MDNYRNTDFSYNPAVIDIFKMRDNNIITFIESEKQRVIDLINPKLSKTDPTKNKQRQTRRELIDIGKFIAASKENIEILDADFEVPDFLITWNGDLFGLEHTEVIDQERRILLKKLNG